MRIELQAFNGPVYVVQEDYIEDIAGRIPKTLIEFAEDLAGTTPADTDAAIVDLIAAGYLIRLGREESPIY